MTKGKWKEAMDECVDAVTKELRDAAHDVLHRSFSRYPAMFNLLR